MHAGSLYTFRRPARLSCRRERSLHHFGPPVHSEKGPASRLATESAPFSLYSFCAADDVFTRLQKRIADDRFSFGLNCSGIVRPVPVFLPMHIPCGGMGRPKTVLGKENPQRCDLTQVFRRCRSPAAGALKSALPVRGALDGTPSPEQTGSAFLLWKILRCHAL